MIRFLPLMGLLFILEMSLAADKMLEGKLTSPYESCKGKLLVDSEDYKKNQKEWDDYSEKCQQELIPTQGVAISDITSPLKEAAYLTFAQRVALEVKNNLKRHQAFNECTAQCFEGAKNCGEVSCEERKKTILEKLTVSSRKARIELALSRSSSDMFSISPRNILSLSDEQRINSDLKDFEIGPNPVGRNKLSAREQKEAQRRLKLDKEKVAEAAKNRNLSHDYDWISFQQMKKLEEHQTRYKDIIYIESPLLATIGTPDKITDGEASWTPKQIAEAARSLMKNAEETLEVVDLSLKDNKLEYSRWKGEAMGQWLYSRLPGTTYRQDLLFYLGMKNVVETVLKSDPQFCGVATSLHKRLSTKQTQNSAATAVASLAPMGLKFGAQLVGHTGKAVSALTSFQSNPIVGLALGSTFPVDSISKFNLTKKEATVGLRQVDEIKKARSNAKMGAAVAVLNVGNAVNVGKTAYEKLAILRRPSTTGQEATHAWLMDKISSAVDAKVITVKEAVLLKEKSARHLMDTLAKDIEKLHPEYFKDANNMNFFLKASAIVSKTKTGDPADIGVKVQDLFLTINQEAMKNLWKPQAQRGLLSVLDHSMTELRDAFKHDPVAYAKFTTDVVSKQKIFRKALKRAGVKDDKVKVLSECVFPGKKKI